MAGEHPSSATPPEDPARPPSCRVLVVVVAYQSAAHLPRLYAAMRAQSLDDWGLVIVDNASRAEARPPAPPADERIQVIQLESNLGFAAGCNLGARAGASPFIAFLNPDAFPEPGWLAELLAAADRHPQAAAFGSTQIRAEDPALLDGAGDVLFFAGLPYRALYGRPIALLPRNEGETFSACAAAMLVRRADFEAVGGFDERFFCFCEDVDLGFRLRLAGRTTIQAPAAVVHHVGGGSTGVRSAFADYHGARNRVWLFVKNMPGPLFWLLAPLHLAATLAVLALHLAAGRGGAGWRGFADGLRGAPGFWAERRKMEAGRRASSIEIARALSWSPAALAGRRAVIRRPSGPKP